MGLICLSGSLLTMGPDGILLLGRRSRFSCLIHRIDGPTGGDQEQPLVSTTCGTLLHTESGQTLLALSLSEITPREGRYITVPIIHLHGPREELRGSQANSQAGVEVTASGC